MAYVLEAIGFYTVNGLDATAERYNSAASMEGERALFLVAQDGLDVLAAPLDGLLLGPAAGTIYEPLIRHTSELATEESGWYELQGINALTGLAELQRAFIVERDGFVFWAAHSILLENLENTTREYVNKAIARYEAQGLDATIAYYNSFESLGGQFYLFLIGADDIYLAHPIFPHLIGTDIKDVVGSDGYELGKDIAMATEEGHWVKYLWPHPVTRREQQKAAWVIRHDGLVFASGYYSRGPETGSREWLDADPREYTMRFVHRAIERYENDGLESMLNYYNSVASFEGQWYLFATDANDIYNVHPLLPHLRGTDIKDVVGSDGYELGKALAAATEEGIWVEYLWPHPVTLQETPKISYAARHDGILFASGYYEGSANVAVRTREYVQKAVNYYKENGREDTIARYGSEESFEGQWTLALADENDVLIVIHFLPQFMDSLLAELTVLDGQEIGREMAAATEDGIWTTYVVPVPDASETVYGHVWAVRYDGLLFMSQYYDERPEVPAEALWPRKFEQEAYSRWIVQQVVGLAERDGIDAAIAYANDPANVDGQWYIGIIGPDGRSVGHFNPEVRGTDLRNFVDARGIDHGDALIDIPEEGAWVSYYFLNPDTGRTHLKHSWGVKYEGYVIGTGWYEE